MQQTGLCLSQATSTPDLSLSRVLLSVSLTSLHHLLTAAQMPGTVLYSSSPLIVISPQTTLKWILCWFFLLCSCLFQTSVFYLLSKPALAAFSSSASSTHFINTLFTSACRSLITMLNTWQFAQEAAISGVDDLFYFPFAERASKVAEMAGHGKA